MRHRTLKKNLNKWLRLSNLYWYRTLSTPSTRNYDKFVIAENNYIFYKKKVKEEK